MATLYTSATEFLANALTITRGTVSDILTVGVFHAIDPNEVPTVADFTTVTLADGTTEPPGDLAQPGVLDVLSLIGPRNGDVTLTAGDWQRWVLVTTETEDVVRKVDVVTVVGTAA